MYILIKLKMEIQNIIFRMILKCLEWFSLINLKVLTKMKVLPTTSWPKS